MHADYSLIVSLYPLGPDPRFVSYSYLIMDGGYLCTWTCVRISEVIFHNRCTPIIHLEITEIYYEIARVIQSDKGVRLESKYPFIVRLHRNDIRNSIYLVADEISIVNVPIKTLYFSIYDISRRCIKSMCSPHMASWYSRWLRCGPHATY